MEREIGELGVVLMEERGGGADFWEKKRVSFGSKNQPHTLICTHH